MRESAFSKSERYLLSGRIVVEHVAGDVIIATCAGDEGDVYRVEWDRQRRAWSCSCPALSMRCAHVLAVARVVRKPS